MILQHTVTGRRGIKAKLTAMFSDDQLAIKIMFSDVSDQDRIYTSSAKDFHHPLQRGLNLTKGGNNTFRKIYKHIHQQIFKIWEDESSIDVGHELRELHRYLVVVQDEFLARLDASLCKLSRRFSTHRWEYYKFFKAHTGPRIRQLVETCPGLVSILVIGKYHKVIPFALDMKLKRDIVKGVSIRSVLKEIFDHLSQSDNEYFNIWERLRQWAPGRMESVEKDWIWLVTSATPLVSGGMLLMPPPAHLPKSHLPQGSRAKASWYRRLHSFFFMMIPEACLNLTMKQARGFTLMASQADHKFYRYVTGRKSETIEYLQGTGRTPTSKMNYKNFFKEVSDWKRINRHPDGYELEKNKALEEVNETNIVQPSSWEYQDHEIWMRPLITVDDYSNESKLMVNCTRKLWYSAYIKSSIHYHVIYKENHYTLEIKLPQIYMETCKGYKNTEPEKELLIKIDSVLKANRSEIRNHLNGEGYKIKEPEPVVGSSGKCYAISSIIDQLELGANPIGS